jgi:hypothetical protein
MLTRTMAATPSLAFYHSSWGGDSDTELEEDYTYLENEEDEEDDMELEERYQTGGEENEHVEDENMGRMDKPDQPIIMR